MSMLYACLIEIKLFFAILKHKLHFSQGVLARCQTDQCCHNKEFASFQENGWFPPYSYPSDFDRFGSVHIRNQRCRRELKSQQTQLLKKPQQSFHLDLMSPLYWLWCPINLILGIYKIKLMYCVPEYLISSQILLVFGSHCPNFVQIVISL